jgi:hypothetical protein
MVTAINIENLPEVFYQVGRLLELMLDFDPLDQAPYTRVQQPSPPVKVRDRLKLIKEEEKEDVRTVGTNHNGKPNLEGFFDYSPTLSYADVTYNLLYGYMNATLGFSSLNQEKCIEILGKFYTNITRDMPYQIMN